MNSNIITEDEEYDQPEEEIQKIKENYFSTNFENYITILKQPTETMSTIMHKLTIEEVKSILFQSTIIKKKILNFTMEEKEKNKLFQTVKENVQLLMEKMKKDSNKDYVFLKFSCRSPKDITPTNQKTLNYYEMLVEKRIKKMEKEKKNSEIEKIEKKKINSDFIDNNKKLIYLYEAAKNCLRFKNIEEGFEFFLQSQRIIFDLKLDIRFPKSFNQSIIIREWIDHLKLKHEFRGFVYKGKLIAVSQYFTQCFFKSLIIDGFKN